LKKSHRGNIQQNMDDVVVLVFSSSRSDPIQRRKWRRLREMHTYSGRWDRQHDGVVSMVESMHRQGFACLRGGRRTEKEGFKNRAAAPRELGLPSRRLHWCFYRRMLGLRTSLRTMQVDQHPPATAVWLDPIERCNRVSTSRPPGPSSPLARRQPKG
jgi:hypothetical protein